MSLERAYTMFRNMGLRHLLVVDEHNRVQGIVTNTGRGCRNAARLAAARAA
jgi:CBS-domain-containing membrane protein